MMKYLKGLLLPALLAFLPTATAANEPLVETTLFGGSELVNLLYFDDSSIVLVQELQTGKIFRSVDAGFKWQELKELSGGLGIIKNPYDNNVALVLGEDTHRITYNQGEKWTEFKTEYPPTFSGPPVSWHAQDSKKIMIHEIEDCRDKPCLGKTYYTTDGFESKPKVLIEERRMCQWAKGSERFLEGQEKHDSRALCITKGRYSDRTKDFRLLISDNFFKDSEEPIMSAGRTVQGMANMAAVKGYLVVAAKSDHSSELSLYVTEDTDSWSHAQFGAGKIEEEAYTILESTNYSIQVDVMTSKYVAMGSLYTSNSNGTYFTQNVEHTNRNDAGFVDFEKLANIQGVVLVNIVGNPEQVERGQGKKLKSRISFDDGRTFENLKVKGTGEDLHLHSVTNLHNSGRVFSSPAPGIVMGVGNTGDELEKYTNGDLYVSDDAGLTWELALQEAHKYEFGDQGSVLVAVFDEGETDKIMYSLKHGRKDSWEAIKLEYKIRAQELTTLSDSTTLKFLLSGSRKKKGGGRENVIVHLDFSQLHARKCEDKDFDSKWSVRVDEENNPSCVMGHKQLFRRRKWDADCFVGEAFKDPVPTFEPCECDEVRDFECDFNFKPEGKDKDKKCVPSESFRVPNDACEGDKKTYMGSSGWRKIPGDQCKGGSKRDEEIERKCDDSDIPPPKKNGITSEITPFKGSEFMQQYYLERPTQQRDEDNPGNQRDHDETVVMLTDERVAWITHDHGKKWKKAVDDEVVQIYPHQYDNNYVYFLTASKKFYASEDRGLRDSIRSYQAPVAPNQHKLQILQFHPKEKGWLIWMGDKNCDKPNSKDCHTVAYVNQKNGQDEAWEPLVSYVKKCAFVWREAGRDVKEEQVFCEHHTNEELNAPLELISSDDWFKKKDVKFESVVEFALMSEFIVVATKDGDGTLRLDASLDANTFAEAKFPPKFFDIHQTAYTVLDSSTHAIFLHVTVNPRPDQEYGSIIKSNSNGTSYVLSLEAVNRNFDGYVDFEKMQGLEGVAVANIVANVDEVNKGAKKKKQTRITHNDGAQWEPLKPPSVDSDGKASECGDKKIAECSLHIHGYTERADPREMYSSPTAVGLMLGVGNLGPELGTFGEANTYMTTDAGITWKEIKKGSYAWEFGDQGSIIVIVRRGEDVDHVYYSLDSGDNWNLYKFSPKRIRVEAITTVPSDTSLNFLLWGKDGKELVAVNLDFSGLEDFKRDCKLDENNPTKGDFDLWVPQHPLQPDKQCLFGHVAEYHRKKRDSKCKTNAAITHMHNIRENCTCTRQDYECAYNYERKTGGECKPIEGLELKDPKYICDEGAKEYWGVSAYRKIPLSTCSGGQEYDHVGEPRPCPGFEEEFQKKHGIGGFALFIAIVLPFAAAGGIGYYVWRNWDGKFGRIRLGDTGSAFDSESPLVKWPIAAISGLVAVVAAIPMLIGSLYRMIAGRMGGGYGGRTYTSRSSFARGRGDYAVVDPDEGELLGEDSDEDV